MHERYLKKKKRRKELSLVKNNQPEGNELSHDFLKALCWLCNSFCTKVVERETQGTRAGARSLPEASGWVGGGAGEEPIPGGRAICSFPSWKFIRLRSGTRCSSSEGAKLCRSKCTEGRLGMCLPVLGGDAWLPHSSAQEPEHVAPLGEIKPHHWKCRLQTVRSGEVKHQ